MNVLTSGWNLLRQTASDWSSDNAPRLGAALAYYTVFSVSPLMIIVLAIAGLWFGRQAAQQQVFAEIAGLVGKDGADAIAKILAHAQEPHTGTVATILAGVTLLIGATGVFVELQDALNTVWGVKPKASAGWLNFIRSRLLSFAMILAIGFLLLVSLILSAALTAVGGYLNRLAPGIHTVWQGVNFLLSFGVITFLFALIFKVLPDVKISWKDVWTGAVITAFLFTLGKFLLGLYLGRTSVASTYGAAGSVVIILIWVYYSAQILFFGAEFTQVYATQFSKRLKPVDYAEPIQVEDKVPAALKRRTGARRPKEPAVTNGSQSAAKPRSNWKDWAITLPLTALVAWFWSRERKRN